MAEANAAALSQVIQKFWPDDHWTLSPGDWRNKSFLAGSTPSLPLKMLRATPRKQALKKSNRPAAAHETDLIASDGQMKSALRIGIFIIAILPALSLFGGARHFTFLYEANTSAPGSLELENWVTWQHATGLGRFDQVDFRHELEYGVTDKLQASIYVADWFYETDPERSGFIYSDSAIELIYNLTNPVLDPVGLSLYGELKAGDRLVELESKFIAQKNLGLLILLYNATLESVWEGDDLMEREGEFQQALGASYEISPRISVGMELLHEFVFPGWRDTEKIRNVFVGPNASYRRGNWFVTVTALAQATDTHDEPDFQVRTIFGIGL